MRKGGKAREGGLMDESIWKQCFAVASVSGFLGFYENGNAAC